MFRNHKIFQYQLLSQQSSDELFDVVEINTNYFNNLPVELLVQIASFLVLSGHLRQLAQVDKRFYQIVANEYIHIKNSTEHTSLTLNNASQSIIWL